MGGKGNKKIKYKSKGQAARLIKQHKKSGGNTGIFGKAAKLHDQSVLAVSKSVLKQLRKIYPKLEFRLRLKISKKEINDKLNAIDDRLGKTLFVGNSQIKPDGGVIEVKDVKENWRIILVSESKHQGNDIVKIEAGIKQGKKNNQDLMVAGNAIERAHKNIQEIRNFMIDENHFPYVIFLQGTNFATKTKIIIAPDKRKIKIRHDSGGMNRIDRLTASNYGMEINQNHCRNHTIADRSLQAASLYFQCNAWSKTKMRQIMLAIAATSLEVLSEAKAVAI